MVLVVILGRTGRTEFNFPATIAALVANVALNLLLVPSLGIVGAGLALVASYLVVVALMYVLHPAALPGPLRMGPPGPGGAGLGRPGRRRRAADADRRRRRPARPHRPLGSPTRSALLVSGFFTAEERGWLARLRHPGELAAEFQRLRAAPSRGRRPRSRRPTRPSAWTRTRRCLSVRHAVVV